MAQVIWQGGGEGAAEVIAGALRARGIAATILASREVPQSAGAFFPGTTWSVAVPNRQALRARTLLLESGEDGNLVGDPDSIAADTLRVHARALVMGAVVLAVILAVTAIYSWR